MLSARAVGANKEGHAWSGIKQLKGGLGDSNYSTSYDKHGNWRERSNARPVTLTRVKHHVASHV